MIRCSFGGKIVFVGPDDLYTPLHIEKVATEVARQAALLPLEIVEENPTPLFPYFKQLLEARHRAASLQLSDAADFGCSLVRNAKANLSRPFRSLLDLKGAFQDVPAILVGAGPSLEENGHLLGNFANQAILFAGGHALKKIPCTPHFGALIDKHPPEFSFSHPEIPLCFQARAHPDHFIGQSGEALLVPDSHFAFISGDLFDGGWTVGNFMAAIAVYLGCNPIVCVGMDYCYREGRKYAFEGEVSHCETQDDWLMSVSWLEELAKKHPEKTFLNASRGLKYFTSCRLEELSFKERPIKEMIHRAIAKLPIQAATIESTDELLYPLWKIWEPVFARAGDFSEEQMKIHQKLFFEQVIHEHRYI